MAEAPTVPLPTDQPANPQLQGTMPEITADMTDDALHRALGGQIVDISQGITSNSADAAQQHLNHETTQGGVRGFVKKIWIGNYVRDFVHQRHVTRNRETLTDSGNMYGLHGGDEAAHADASQAIVERFQNDWLMHGETNPEVTESDHGSVLAAAMRDSVRAFSRNGDMDALREARTRSLSEYGTHVKAEDRNKGLLFADNWIQVAQNAKAAVDHGIGLDRVEAAMSIKSGVASVGAQTEAHFTAVDRTVDKLYKTRVGSLVNDATLSLAAGATMAAVKFTTGRAANALGATVGMGVGAGVVAGVREHYHFKQDRKTHIREMEEGGVIDVDNGKRRRSMDATTYEMMAASDLIGDLFLAATHETADASQLREMVDTIGNAKTRMDLSAVNKKGLVRYSSKLELEGERTDIYRGIARAELNLNRLLQAADDATLAAANISSRDADAVVTERINTVTEMVNEDISQKDRAGMILGAKRTLAFGALGAVSAIAVGEAVQHLAGVGSTGAKEVTAHKPAGDHTVVPILDHHAGVEVPKGYHLVQEHGKWDLIGAHGKVIDGNVTFTADGHLSEATRHLLDERHIGVFSRPESVTVPGTTIPGSTTEVTRTPGEYFKAHPDRFTKVHRELWYDNNTPNIYDDNELKLDWGGVNGTGIDANGNYVLTIAGMTPGGSFHDGLSANAQALIREGKMQLGVTMFKDHQQEEIIFHVNKLGQVVFNRHSFVGRSAFEKVDGHAQILAPFIEAYQNMGVDPKNGSEHVRVLATAVGTGHMHAAKDIITTPPVKTAPQAFEGTLTTLQPPETVTGSVADPFVFPVYGRSGLEDLVPPAPVTETGDEPVLTPEERRRREYNPGYRPGGAPGEREAIDARALRDRMPELSDNPNARILLGNAVRWNSNRIRRDAPPEYMRELLDTIAQTPELANLDDKTRAIDTILVGARQESDNIYHTLSLYAEQSVDTSKEATLLLLHVNWIDADLQDPIKAAKIEKTWQEIDRARQDFPELRIATIQSEWSRQQLDSGGYGERLIGHASQKMYDAAMLATEQAIDAGRVQEDGDILLIKNDADAQGMSHDYLDKMIRAFEEHPEADVFTGGVHWGLRRYGDLPGFGYVATFFETARIAAQLSQVDGYQTSFGVNTAMRMSTFAAVGGIGYYGTHMETAPDDLAIGERIMAARQGRDSLASVPGPYGSSSQTGGDYNYHRHVGGAVIDTDADRMESRYVQGRPITNSWEDAGVSDRDAGLQAGTTEDLRTRAGRAEVIARVESNMNALMTYWITDPKQVMTTLVFMTPDPSAYELTRDGDGTPHFKFTPKGRQWLVHTLDGRRGSVSPSDGRLRYRRVDDAYGAQKLRRWYGEGGEAGSARPRSTWSRRRAPLVAGRR